MKFLYRYLVLILLGLILTTTITPVAAKYPISLNPSLIATEKSSTLLEQGKQLYNQGKLNQAAQVWEKAVIEFERKGKLRNQVLANNYLSIVYQDLGKWDFAQKSVNQALKLVKEVDDRLLYAQVLNTKGSLELKTGNAQTALDSWKQSEQIYRKLDDVTGIVLSQINQAQALQNLGFYRRGRTKLEQVAIELDKLPDSLIKARGLRSLGNILQAIGDSDNSQKVLLQSLNIAQKLNSKTDVAQGLLILGNSAKVNDDISTALDYYQQAAAIAPDNPSKLSAKINQFSLLIKAEQSASALELYTEIKNLLLLLPSSRFSVYSRVNLAQSVIGHRAWGIGHGDLADILAEAVKQARELQDIRAESYAVGQLGHLYEQTNQFSEALNLTRNGLNLANNIQASDIAATLLWQQGRIYKARGNQEAAITAYSQAVDNLESLRQDLVQMNPNIQFSFRDEVEPVYRELVQLLLQDVDNLNPQISQQLIHKSHQII